MTRAFRPSRRLAIAGLLALGAAGTAALGAPGAQKRVLLTLDLRSSVIEPLSIDQRAIVYNDATGRTREAPAAMVAAILPVDDHAVIGSNEPGLLILTDGQRFPGQRAGVSPEPDTLAWTHPELGAIVAPLDIVSEARFSQFLATGEPVTLRATDTDEVLLANSDRLLGFIESLGDPVIIETDAGDVSAAMDLVAGARLANPRVPLAGTALWLSDGTVARVRALESDGRGGAAVTLPDGQSALLTLEQIVGVAFDASRLRPLARLEIRAQASINERPLLDGVVILDSPWAPVALDAPDVELPGPMEVRWALPAGAERFGAVATLPRESWSWGDCELVVLVDGVEALRERVNRERSSIEFSVPARGEELTIRVEPGVYGPVLDRIVLERALVLLAPGEG